MSTVLPIARDGHLRRNTLVDLDSALVRLNNTGFYTEVKPLRDIPKTAAKGTG